MNLTDHPSTHEYALNGIPEILLCEGDHAGREEGRGRDPVVQPEDGAVDAHGVEVGEPTDRVQDVQTAAIDHPEKLIMSQLTIPVDSLIEYERLFIFSGHEINCIKYISTFKNIKTFSSTIRI